MLKKKKDQAYNAAVDLLYEKRVRWKDGINLVESEESVFSFDFNINLSDSKESITCLQRATLPNIDK